MIKANADYVFESSWEVCNKCGGINTVIKTKAPHMLQYYTNYFFIGPYFKDKADIELVEIEIPEFLKKIFEELKRSGIICYYGKWQIRGEPNTILIDFKNHLFDLNEAKKRLWDNFKVDSLGSYFDFNEPVEWSWCVGILLEHIEKALGEKKIIAHFHEWMAGIGLLYLKQAGSKIKTIFTTHATMLGRSLAGNGYDLYGHLNDFDPTQKAREFGISAKHTAEVACAITADIFTTVSEITSIEAEHILGRKADILLLNGIDLEKFPTIEETSIKHVNCRGQLREFLTYHFFPYYSFNLDHNIMFFFAGRYEFGNKGMDILIKALGILNEKLKKEMALRTVTIFFWVPMRTYGIKFSLLENKNYYRHIKTLVDDKSNKILQQIVNDFVSKKTEIEGESFFEKELMKDLKRNILAFHRSGNPAILTHNIENEENDPLVQGLLMEGLDNKEDDRVKVVVYPVYLNGSDGLLNLSHYDAMAGCHFGLFPSYYEPWGYTPVEAAAIGVPSLTSDLSGFGRFIKNHLINPANPGIYILERMGKTKEEEINHLVEIMYDFCGKDHSERVQKKINAKYLSNLCDWKHFVKYYVEAHNKALEK